MGKFGKFLKTVVFGGIIGLVAGILFAPGKGEETRAKLKEALDKGKGKFGELKEEFTKKEEL